MGKVTATELKDVRVDFVSFVEEGANGQKFAIFKSADYMPENNENETNDFSKEEKGILKRFVDSFRKHMKIEKEEEQIMKELAEKILAALGAMQKSLETLSGGFSKLEKSLLKEEAGDAGEGHRSADQPAGGNTSAGEGGVDGASGGNNPPAPTNDTPEGDDSAGQTADALTKAIEAMTKTIESLARRVEDVEKRRNPSNAISTEKESTAAPEANVFKGVF